jgi:hypothetical protein
MKCRVRIHIDEVLECEGEDTAVLELMDRVTSSNTDIGAWLSDNAKVTGSRKEETI